MILRRYYAMNPKAFLERHKRLTASVAGVVNSESKGKQIRVNKQSLCLHALTLGLADASK
jgi:hypothetical protein